MSKRLHLSLIAGFLLLTASRGAAQVNTSKPGESVELHLSGDQPAREWSLGPTGTDDIKRIKVCRVQTVCKMQFREGQTPRTRVRTCAPVAGAAMRRMKMSAGLPLPSSP